MISWFWYWFLISLTSYFTVGTSRWDTVYALMFMLLFPLTVTTKILCNVFIYDGWLVVSDPLSSRASTVMVLLECYRVTGNIYKKKCFEVVFKCLLITCWSCSFCWRYCWRCWSCCCLFLLSAFESALLEGGL